MMGCSRVSVLVCCTGGHIGRGKRAGGTVCGGQALVTAVVWGVMLPLLLETGQLWSCMRASVLVVGGGQPAECRLKSASSAFP